MQSAMDDRRNLLADLDRLPNGALVVAAGGHEAAEAQPETSVAAH
jgi:hypothetical protein